MKLLLAGGGHTHVAALPAIAAALAGRADIALVAPGDRMLYSGMMPGWLAGQYRFDDCAIPLRRLCERLGVAWVQDTLVDVDFDRRVAIGSGGQRHPFDLLSLNVGSAHRVPGAAATSPDYPWLLAAKPFATFAHRWERWLRTIGSAGAPARIAVVGGGAAGVEIAFALARRFGVEPQRTGREPDHRHGVGPGGTALTILTRGGVLDGHSALARNLAARSLRARGVAVEGDVEWRGIVGDALLFDRAGGGGEHRIRADLAVVATGARPPDWLAGAARRDGVAVDDEGAIAVDMAMQSRTHPEVFACGDCAGFSPLRVPRSGVHALRQAPVLARSLLRAAGATDPAPSKPPGYRPQRRALVLLNRCDGSAIGDWGAIGFAGRAAWRWKDRIDRRFVDRIADPDRALDAGFL